MLVRTVLFFSFILIFTNFSHSQTGWINVSIGNSDYKGIFFPSQDTGFALRNDGIVLKTLDKGNQWNTINTQVTNLIIGSFTSSSLGAIWGIPPKITTNGGLSWNSISNQINIYGLGWISGFTFLNQTTGFVIGGDFYPLPTPCCLDGLINKTTNAGQNWIEVERNPGLQLEDIHIADENNIIVLASIGLLISTDSGNSWSLTTSLFGNIQYIHGKSMSNPFKDTIFVAGYITRGNDTAIVARSTDGGGSWSRSFVATFNSRFRKLQFLDNNIGYAVGDTGLIVSTTNGGTNWTIHNGGTRKRLNGVAFINKDTGFVVGDSGLILKTFTGGLVDISQELGSIPSDFKLHQNFPNPFNPTTKINFDLPKDGKVYLVIYDILGKEIMKTVNNEFKPAGRYTISFNGSNLASGVYFYRIVTGNFVQTKRMVLIK